MSGNSIRARAGLPLLVRHVAVRLSVSERTVRWWAETGQLPGRRFKVKIWGFEESAVIAFALRRGCDRWAA